MAQAYQSVNSFRQSGNQVCMKHEDYEPTFFDNFICLRLDAF